MTKYVALYVGPDVQSARFVCATADPELVRAVAESALMMSQTPPTDPILIPLHEGRQRALKEVLRQASE